MKRVVRLALAALLIAEAAFSAPDRSPVSASAVRSLEQAYADFNDADGAISLIDSNPARYGAEGYGGRTREQWKQIYTDKRAALTRGLHSIAAVAKVSPRQARAIQLMRDAVAESSAAPQSLAPAGECKAAAQQDQTLQQLQAALYACFAEKGNSLEFEGTKVTRVAAFDLLTRLDSPERRQALFMAFVPLWQALNADDEASSPYRRMIRMAAADGARAGSPVEAAANTVNASVPEAEQWLVRILESWSTADGPQMREPWDFRYVNGAADRQLGDRISRESMVSVSERYYRDLGLDLAGSGILFDLDPRPGKAPLAYTDYVRRGRLRGTKWQPTLVRVSASYESGGLGPLNELIHEEGHAAHMLGLHTTPAFMDLGDPIFYEAVADVPAWSVYEPKWQEKYLGVSAPEVDSLRALYSNVVLDVAWALFDLRMLRDPGTDPNRLWTQITARYLHITPHPELAWWAVRVQLVDKPGYMMNYGLGAVITADIRQRILQQSGSFETGDPRWYRWLCEHLFRTGEEVATRQLLPAFLGRGVSPEALIGQLRRISPRSDSQVASGAVPVF